MADLRREYGIDLLDFWRSRLSFYELCAYLKGLPEECRTVALIRNLPDEAIGWGTTQVLLASLLDQVRGMFADKPPESVIPKALTQGPQPKAAPMQDIRALSGLFGSPEDFARKHGKGS